MNIEPISQASLNLTTGGLRARQAVQLIDMRGRWCLYGQVGQMCHELDTGGPLDAPDTMASGAINSTEWRGSGGQALARPSEYIRG